MWQIMWIINLIPEVVLQWLINLMIVTGLVGLFSASIGRWIPIINNYTRWLKPVGIVLLCAGIFLKGGYATEMSWRAKVAELEAKVKVAEEKSKQANEELAKSLKDKKNKTKEVQVVIQERIREIEKKIDAECKVDQEAIDILNDAAKNKLGSKK
jgi:hypothetical protein